MPGICNVNKYYYSICFQRKICFAILNLPVHTVLICKRVSGNTQQSPICNTYYQNTFNLCKWYLHVIFIQIWYKLFFVVFSFFIKTFCILVINFWDLFYLVFSIFNVFVNVPVFHVYRLIMMLFLFFLHSSFTHEVFQLTAGETKL